MTTIDRTNQEGHKAMEMDPQTEQNLAIKALLRDVRLDDVIPVGGRWGREYASIVQKKTSCNFEFPKVSSPVDLVRSLSELRAKGFYFRGQRSSTWKVYSSWQRKFLARDHKVCDDTFQTEISRLLATIRENDLTKNVIGVSAANLFDYEILGHLQHHGVATPFVDFAKSPLVALFFATQDSENGMFSHHSVYAVDGRFQEHDNEIFDYEDWLKVNDASGLAKKELVRRGLHRFESWNASALLFHVDGTEWETEIRKRRIANQTGLFVYMNNGDKPVEEYFSEFRKLACSNATSCDSRIMRRMICFDFPSAWDDEIRSVLDENKINDDFLGLSDHETEILWEKLLRPDFPELF